MNFAMWAYPWDILEEGAESVINQLTEAGIDEVNLATNYHAVHSFSPTSPGRKSFFARSSAYFQPRNEYGSLTPVPAEAMGDDDWVGEITDEFATTDISVNAWTIGCHNSRLGLSHPEYTITSPFGDSLAFGLCPSNPAVQSYLTGLVRDLDSRDAFERIELETFDYFHGSGLGWHHDKVFIERGDLGEFLLGLCFCEHCQEKAVAEGVDVDYARQHCIDTLETISSQHGHPSTSPREWLHSHPAVRDYIGVREYTLAKLFDNLQTTTDHELGYYVGILDVGDEWLFGADLELLSNSVDYYTVIAYESSPQAAAARIKTIDELTPSLPIHAGIQPGPPVVNDRQTVHEIVSSIIDAGAERISFYNYGQLPERCFDWIKDVTTSYR